MDFDLSDWTADSHVLKLDKQLFSPKEQLTVFTVGKSSTKHKKRKLDKTDDTQQQCQKNTVTENVKLPKHKQLKKERLKQLKKDKLLEIKQLDDIDNGKNKSERGLQKKKKKIVKIKRSGDANNEESPSDRGSQKKKEKLLKRKLSDDVDYEKNQSEKGSQKKKRKIFEQDSIPSSENNSMLKSGKKSKLGQGKKGSHSLKEKGTENVTNDSKSNEELNSSKLSDNKKRKKKKKSSSKKNKYKHLDEERARLRQSLGVDTGESVKKAPETFKVKVIENEKSDSPKTKSTEFNVSSGVSVSKKKNKKKSLGISCPERPQDVSSDVLVSKKKKKKKSVGIRCPASPQEQKEQIVVNNGHKVKSEGKHTKSSKNAPFNLSKLHKILSPKELTTNEKTNVVKESSVDHKTDTQHSPEKKKDKSVSLRDRMMEQLKSARFRYINEQLYTKSGSEAAELFKEDKESFHCYHEGFQNQVEKWPTNPVDVIIKQIESGSKTAVIGDFGCGDAKIARSVPNKVHSFDLVALNEHVTVCNIQKVPLKNNSLDTAVYCLSLMGTNLAEYLGEANRVLRKGGTLMIAEVASRIERIGKFIRNIERMGFRVKNRDDSNDMFVLLDFMKIGAPGDRLPEITLEPCVYKKR